jgi:cholesterol transport system auxiliary component
MTMTRASIHLALATAVLAAGLSGCALTPPPRETPAQYDLGPLPSYERSNPSFLPVLLVPDVSAPSLLEGQGIVYRLAYDEPSRVRTYAQSRWKAPVPVLLSQRLRGRFAAATQRGIVTGDDGARAEYMLRVELEEFSQVFAAPGVSRVSVRARASLVSLEARRLSAQRTFSIEVPAASPDAQGAVTALAAASDELVERLLEWTSEQLRTAVAKQ